jgi:hypothetical protein
VVSTRRFEMLSDDSLPGRAAQAPLAGGRFGASPTNRLLGPAAPGQLRRDLEAVGLIVGVLAILLGLVVGLGVTAP